MEENKFGITFAEQAGVIPGTREISKNYKEIEHVEHKTYDMQVYS